MAGRGGKESQKKSEEEPLDIGEAMIVLTRSVAGIQQELTKLNSRVTDLDSKLDDALNETAEAVAIRLKAEYDPLLQDLRKDIDNALVKQIQLE